jgi:2-polyprenyl-3-methyl-5-hydroxy-6-metoxy-1,4-benzoquinol methylase
MDKKPDIAYYNAHRTDLNHLLPANPKRILEIGGGAGAFRRNFPADVEYWLVEPVREVAELARSRVHRVLTGTYDAIEDQLPDKYFDLVVCNDVIEHMPDWRKFLIAIQSKMARDSALVGSIPNVRHFVNIYNFLFKKDWEYTETGILETTHFAFFTEKSLRRELARANFDVQAFELMKAFVYTSGQSRWKYIASLILIRLLGRDSRYGQFGFRCGLKQSDL